MEVAGVARGVLAGVLAAEGEWEGAREELIEEGADSRRLLTRFLY